MPQEFISPVGRIVQGSVFEPNLTDSKGNRLKVKTGPNAGQETQNYFLALAVPKTQAAWWLEPDPFWMQVYNEGRTGYPQHFNPQTGACQHPRFAFKIVDGDGIDNDGKSNAQKEGQAGHWVIKFSTTICPKGVFNGKYLNPQDAAEKNAIKRGHFARVMGSMRPNTGSDVPGVYLNQAGVEWIAYGPEIISGPDALAAFAAAPKPVNLPPGASMTPPPGATPMGGPTTPAAMPPGVMAAQSGGPAPLPAMGQPAMQPAALPVPAAGAPIAAPPGAPNHAFVQNAIAPAAPPAMPALAPVAAPPAQPVYQMTAAAGGFTREQYNAQGWTDAVLLEKQMMVRVA